MDRGIERDFWHDQPDLVRSIIEQTADYEQLCGEAAYILRKRLEQERIVFSAVTSRAKSLTSSLEKMRRKRYSSVDEITDFAGVRVVYLYAADIERVERIVRSEFRVLEKIDKQAERGASEFGYVGKHFVVVLGEASSGARYEDLEGLRCEIQVRTVLQDAWAIVQYHLVYKREEEVPKRLQRRLNGLAGLFESVDEQFDSIRCEREEYLTQVRASQDTPSQFLRNELNIDSLREYLLWKFPDTPMEQWDGQLSLVLSDVNVRRFPTLKKIDIAVDSTLDARARIRGWIGKDVAPDDSRVPAAVEVVWALALQDKEMLQRPNMPPSWRDAVARQLNREDDT